MDLKEYQSQIKELILIRKDPDFNELFNKILVNENSSDKFLIKMEIARLSKPCQRIIDLREKNDSECKAFAYKGIEHFLDESGIKVFNNNISLYGQYTIGTFEDVIKHHSKIKKEQQNNKSVLTKKTQIEQQCELILLSAKNKRAAPRMFYVSDIEIELRNGQKYFVQTTNISTSGLKIKLKEHITITNKEIVKVSFSSFNKEFIEEKVLSGAAYQLVGQDTIDNIQYCYLNYIGNNKNLISFIQEFIRANQYKYKIDVLYYYQLAKNKLLTNYYLADTNKMPVCLDLQSDSPFLFALENNKNKDVIDYWQENTVNKLIPFFINLSVLKQLDKSTRSIETIVYSFTHINNGIKHHFSATEEELIEKELKELFIHYGHNKKSWRIHALSITPYNYRCNKITPEITKEKYTLLNKITHIGTFEDISKIPHFFDKKHYEEKEFNKLNQFLLHNETEQDQNIFQIFPFEQRKEDRYLYKSNILIQFNGNQYSAQILNFSLSGLMVKLDASAKIPRRAELQLTFIDLQKISKKSQLSELNYTVINHNQHNILNLQVTDNKTKKITKNFFSLLIQYNSAHFKKLPTRNSEFSFSDELKKIVEESYSGCTLFVAKESHQPNVKYASINDRHTALKTLFGLLSKDDKAINITPITNNGLYKRLISAPLQARNKNTTLKETIIYIKTQKNREDEWKIQSYLDEDFKNEEERNDFLKYSAENSNIYIFHYRLTSLDLPDFKIIQHEMDAISRFALHLTKKLKEELLTMNGLIEITDCTHIFNKISLQK